ncbi:MAG: hypothetical protein IJP59_05430 [Muribaculaceae bacterium]|nr:hypothetical protein [Muribaculaceae bacterium]
MSKSTVVVRAGNVVIGDKCRIENASIYINKGELVLGEGTIVRDCFIEIDNGKINISHHSKIQCRHLWTRFGGTIKIGSYTNLNHGTEVRADELVEIGSYCQISYNINIWDTNTHNILPQEDRKRLAEQYYPTFGYEEQRPITNPIIIGDYCWIGENASILKGTILGNNVVVGYHTLLLGQNIEDNKKVVQDLSIKII